MLHTKIITLQGILFEGSALEVLLRTAEGTIGVLPGHRNLITQIKKGTVVIHTPDGALSFSTSEGAATITQSSVTLLCSKAEAL